MRTQLKALDAQRDALMAGIELGLSALEALDRPASKAA